MFATAASHLDSPGSYNFIWIIVGVLSIIEAIKGAAGWWSRRVIREKNVDDLLQARKEIASVDKKITVNGKDTDNVGDVSKRTEDKLDKLTLQFTRHNASVNRRLKALEQHAGIVK